MWDVETYTILCGSCGAYVAAQVVQGEPRDPAEPLWLRCPACGDGAVRTRSGVVWPAQPPGDSVSGAPDDVAAAWREARAAAIVGAYTAAEIMCRKILMHVAVDVAAAEPGKTFAAYVDALEGAGYITTGLKQVVDKVRLRGNVANHELSASNQIDCLQTLKITEHLLRSVYELPAL